MLDALLSPKHVARLIGVSVQTLADWRSTGRYGLPYLKVGRLVRYRWSDIETFLRTENPDDGDENPLDDDLDEESDELDDSEESDESDDPDEFEDFDESD